MNILHSAPQTNNLSPERKYESFDDITKRIQDIVAEATKILQEIAEVENNDGNYPRNSQTAGKLRALNTLLDDLTQEKTELLLKKNAILKKREGYTVSEEAFDTVTDPFEKSSDGLILAKHEARARNNTDVWEEGRGFDAPQGSRRAA